MKLLLHNIYHAVISSQAWVAFCFALLCSFVQLINGWNDTILIYISFFATLFAYNLSHWVDDNENWRFLVIVLSGIICIYLGISHVEFKILIILSILAAISILYSCSLTPNTLRNMPQFKIFWIALVWSMTVILPAFSLPNFLTWNLIFLFLSIFCFVIAITIPFDIRDVLIDDDGMQTLPQHYGVKKAIGIGLILLLLSGVFYVIFFSFKLDSKHVSFLISLVIAAIFLLKSHTIENKWVTSFWVEGISALPFILYYML